jgi:Ca2+-binding RTX toxin-like protein
MTLSTFEQTTERFRVGDQSTGPFLGAVLIGTGFTYLFNVETGRDEIVGGTIDRIRVFDGDADYTMRNFPETDVATLNSIGYLDDIFEGAPAFVNVDNGGAASVKLNGASDIQLGFADDTVIGSTGDDFIFTGLGDNVVSGKDGNDVIVADGLFGEIFLPPLPIEGEPALLSVASEIAIDDEPFILFEGNNSFYGGAGEDELYGGFGDDSLYGGDDGDFIDGGYGDDFLFGGNGDDVMVGSVIAQPEDLFQSNDFLSTEVNMMIGGAGDDVMVDGIGNDRLFGGADNDTFFMVAGDNNKVFGGDGDDTLVIGGGGGAVTLGAGIDTVVLTGLQLDGELVPAELFGFEEEYLPVFDGSIGPVEEVDLIELDFQGGSTKILDFDISEDVIELLPVFNEVDGSLDELSTYLVGFFLNTEQTAAGDLVWMSEDGESRVVFKDVDIDDLTFDNFDLTSSFEDLLGF